MAHKEQLEFVSGIKEKYPQFFNNRRVVEIGSRNINGTVRDLFHKCRYTGVDLEEGEGVDVVEDYANYLDSSFLEIGTLYDVIVSCEALEHDRYWGITLERMYYALKPGGLLLVTAAGVGREEHGTSKSKPEDSPSTNGYYRNITNAMAVSVLKPEMFRTYFMNQCPINCDFQFYGIK
jgi:SAM-dependent methyltransferase